MKKFIYNIALVLAMGFVAVSCDLEEEVYDRVDASIYYEDEASIQGALARIYAAGNRANEFFYQLQEFSADQIAWRSWNGGQWGYDEGEKTVLSTHTWTSQSVIIRNAWSNSWTGVGLSNNLINDLNNLDAAQLGMTQEDINAYISEIRTFRAWNYYSLFELWGGVLPIQTTVGSDVPGSVSTDFAEGCKIVFDFLITELDESLAGLPKNEVGRMNQAVNRALKARLLLNAELFIGEDRFAECAELCQDILDGDFGTYSVAADHRDLYSIDNINSPEVIFAYAYEAGQTLIGGVLNQRVMPFVPYNIWDYFGGNYEASVGGAWNCTILAPSFDNSGEVLPTGGTDTGGVSFLDAPYNDKLGAVYARFHNNDIRKKGGNYKGFADGTYQGMFLKGAIKENYGEGAALPADADRDGQDIVFVDQLGTFRNLGRQLETVMSPRWGETTSGVRLVKYPIYPEAAGINMANIDEVEFRLSEVVFMLAECKLRAGDATSAANLVNSVRQRYFDSADWTTAENQWIGGTTFDEDAMLDQWGQEFLNEGRRRRTDLRRFDKFTQGQWWFFGRATDSGASYPAVRDRKYEWFPLPEVALSTNPGLVQNPNY
jgi:hypothetical protein